MPKRRAAKKDSSIMLATGMAAGVVLILLGIFNMTAFITLINNPPMWWDQSQTKAAAEQGGNNTLYACWNDTETYVPQAMLETTVNGVAMNGTWGTVSPVMGLKSILVGEWGPPNQPNINGCMQWNTDCAMNGPTCYIAFNGAKPPHLQCECWCTQNVPICNSSTFVYNVPQTACDQVSWRIFGKDTAGLVNVTNLMNFIINDITVPTYGSLMQNATGIAAGGTNVLSATCFDDCGLKKAYLWTNESQTMAEKTSVALTGKEAIAKFDWNSGTLSETQIEWKIICEDSTGLKAETTPLSFAIGEAADKNAPVLVSAAADKTGPQKGEKVTFTATWTDDKELSSASLEINGAVVDTVNIVGKQATATLTWQTTEAGSFKWVAKASDTSGNTGSSQENTISVSGTCPTCPAATEWFDCVDGTQTRTNYKCGSDTGYGCQAYIETQTCTMPSEGLPLWLIGVVMAIAGAGIVTFVLFKKGLLFKKAATTVPATSRL